MMQCIMHYLKPNFVLPHKWSLPSPTVEFTAGNAGSSSELTNTNPLHRLAQVAFTAWALARFFGDVIIQQNTRTFSCSSSAIVFPLFAVLNSGGCLSKIFLLINSKCPADAWNDFCPSFSKIICEDLRSPESSRKRTKRKALMENPVRKAMSDCLVKKFREFIFFCHEMVVLCIALQTFVGCEEESPPTATDAMQAHLQMAVYDQSRF